MVSREFALVAGRAPVILRAMKNVLTALCLVLAPTAAPAWIAQNGLVVEPSDGSDFSVPYRGKSAPIHFWCAAGDYVITELGRSPATRIYRTSPRRRAGQGIDFSLSPEGATKPGLFMVFGESSISAAHARNLCNIRKH